MTPSTKTHEKRSACRILRSFGGFAKHPSFSPDLSLNAIHRVVSRVSWNEPGHFELNSRAPVKLDRIDPAGLNFRFQTRYRTTLRYRDTYILYRSIESIFDHTRHTQVTKQRVVCESSSVPDLLIHCLQSQTPSPIEKGEGRCDCDQHHTIH
jgi:hypothetical protein